MTVTATFGHSKTSGGSCFSMLCSKQIKFKLTNDDTEKCTVCRQLYLLAHLERKQDIAMQGERTKAAAA